LDGIEMHPIFLSTWMELGWMFISIQNEKMNESINLLSLTEVYISFNGKKMMNVCL
jgi:hypothetical protein